MGTIPMGLEEPIDDVDRVLERWDAYHRVTALMQAHNVEGWIEYWMWEVLEGTKRWPFWLEPSGAILADMRLIRDEAGIWFAWDLEAGKWEPVSLDEWIRRAKASTYRDAQTRCLEFHKKEADKEVLLSPSPEGVEVGEQKAP